MPEQRAPSAKNISHILKQQFHLRYRKLDGALAHYNDPHFDEKRFWACRLLAQFLMDDALVISIDESHIRSGAAKKYAWQFVGNDRDFKKVLYQPLEHIEEEEHDGLLSEWGVISEDLSMQSRTRKRPRAGRSVESEEVGKGNTKRRKATRLDLRSASHSQNSSASSLGIRRKRGRPRKVPELESEESKETGGRSQSELPPRMMDRPGNGGRKLIRERRETESGRERSDDQETPSPSQQKSNSNQSSLNVAQVR